MNTWQVGDLVVYDKTHMDFWSHGTIRYLGSEWIGVVIKMPYLNWVVVSWYHRDSLEATVTNHAHIDELAPYRG